MSAGLGPFAAVARGRAFREVEGLLLGSGRKGRCVLAGLVEPARALYLLLLGRRTARKIALVVADDAALDGYQRDLSAMTALLGGDARRIVALPAMDADPYAGIPPHAEVARQRVVALGRLARGEVDLLLVPVRALLWPVPSVEEIASHVRVLRRGSPLSPDRFALDAMACGYRRVDTVTSPGEISRRGGIVDVFPPEAEEPVRIELFGEAVESLRSFDTDHQRSTGFLEEAVVGPAVENPATDAALARLERRLSAAPAHPEPVPRSARRRLEALVEEGQLPGLEALAALTAERPVGLLDHACGMALVVDGLERAESELARAWNELGASWRESERRFLPPPQRLFFDPLAVRERLREADVVLEDWVGEQDPTGRSVLTVASRSPRAYAGRMAEFAAEVRRQVESGGTVVCAMRGAGSAERLAEIARDYGLHPGLSTRPGDLTGGAGPEAAGLYVVVAGLRAGFELPDSALAVLSERQVFGEEVRAAERRTRGRAAFVSDFRDLKPGDLVVHVDHGLARYRGLGRPSGGSLNRDFMVLEFAGGDRLFVPVDRLDLVQKYTGSGGRRPQLDRLGGPGWERVKTRVRRSVESMARELLELYARRKAAQGHAFSPDTAWQRELESSFPYELTPDQARALEEIKKDMESPHPMDRLLVGDVGFGKTEIAVRAAFKCVMDGLQAAVLTPTTVLAYQHLDTFRERLAPFPVRVEMLSRFVPEAEARRVLAATDSGEVDVLIGTHRLLSKDVRFRRLGLVIVDEEQRFGVADKERLKRLCLGVDVLAMTATPIPRTLQMSLAGVRDLSVIETAPKGRTAIRTYLVPFRRTIVTQAIRQELRRQGQVFVVHDRVETLPALALALREMVPEARLVVAHGKMGERELEQAMLRFYRYEADVLVTTTIVENGLDIPRANTILVHRADRFGLAQLYQLRGRVGRSEQPAYAYFLVPGREALSEEARRRLRALQEFSDLGAGFRLAAADLEIRGAGEFLGTRQHGHIAALGFDLYCQMLEAAVAELRGEPVPERPPVSLHLGVDIKVPDSYMPDMGDRLALYKRLASAREEAEVDRLQADTEDRYGHLPPAARNLFELARLRLVAERAGVRSVDVADARLQIRFHEPPPVEPRRVVELLARQRGALTPSGMMLLPAPDRPSERIGAVRDVLERIGGKAA